MAWVCGWDAISAYIHRCPATAKRYYKHFGMPIHRDPSGRPIALTHQIDIWLVEFNLLENYGQGTPSGKDPFEHHLKMLKAQAKDEPIDKRRKKK